MTAIERVWERMKGCAADFAARGDSISEERALAVVRLLIREECVRPKPPVEAELMYARELLEMIERLSTKIGGRGGARLIVPAYQAYAQAH